MHGSFGVHAVNVGGSLGFHAVNVGAWVPWGSRCERECMGIPWGSRCERE